MTAAPQSRERPESRLQRSDQLRAVLEKGFPLLRFEPELEAGFRAHWRVSATVIARLGMLSAGILLVFFVLLDRYGMGYRYPAPVHFAMLYVCAPTGIVGALLSLTPRFSPRATELSCGLLLINSLVLLWCYPLLIYSPAAAPYTFEGLLVFAAFIYWLSGALFWHATAIAVSNALGFVLIMSATSLSAGTLRCCGFYLLAINAMGIIGGYLREHAARTNFLNAKLVHELAERDPLTGVYNRRAFSERLEKLVLQARRTKVSITVLVMDLDNFKDVNDGAGHHFGDLVLTAAANAVLEVCRRPLDCVARLGGDEFVALWFDLGPPHVEQACDRLLATLAEHFAPLTAKYGHHITMSVGAAHAIPAPWQDGEILLKFADSAMYETKARGRNGFTVVSLDEHSGGKGRNYLHAVLKSAAPRTIDAEDKGIAASQG